MKIKISDLNRLIREELAPAFDREKLRNEQSQKIIDDTNLENAEAAIKVLARQATDPISDGQAKLLKQLNGKTSKDVLRSVVKQLYIDGLNGKSILGYMTMTPNKLKDIINSAKGLERLIAKDEEMEAQEDESEEGEVEGIYNTMAQTGGDPFIDIGKKLGMSTQRAKELTDKAMARLKAAGGLDKVAAPAIEEFIAKLVDAESVTEFVMRTLKLPRATEADIEFLVELKEIAEDNEASAVKVLMDRFMENDNSHLMRRIQDALRPEGAGRPSKIRTYFK